MLANEWINYVVEFWKIVKRMNQGKTGTVNSIENVTVGRKYLWLLDVAL